MSDEPTNVIKEEPVKPIAHFMAHGEWPSSAKPSNTKPSKEERTKASRKFHDYFERLYNGEDLIESELEEQIKVGLKYCPTTVVTHMLYAADRKGMNRSDITAMAIPIVLKYRPALSFIYALVKGLVYQNKWKLMCEFVHDNATSKIRTYALNMIVSHIKCKNHKCLRDLPRQGRVANRIRGYIGLTPVAWRRTLSRGCWGSIYNLMSHRQWSTIKYDRLGAYILADNYKTFMRHDKDRFRTFLLEYPEIAKIVKSIRFQKSKKKYLTQKEIYDTYFIRVDAKKEQEEQGSCKASI